MGHTYVESSENASLKGVCVCMFEQLILLFRLASRGVGDSFPDEKSSWSSECGQLHWH